MKTIFTREEILQGSGCYKNEGGKVESIIGGSGGLTIQQILDLDIPLKDKFWFVRNNCELTDKQLRKLAIGVATIVLPIYETKYPNNKAPMEAIQAAQDYLNGIIDLDELREKRYAAADAADAAYAADADAYAADDAAAAAAAADAAYAAAYAADDAAAAYAAAAAADAAAYAAAADAAFTQQLLDFLKDFVK